MANSSARRREAALALLLAAAVMAPNGGDGVLLTAARVKRNAFGRVVDLADDVTGLVDIATSPDRPEIDVAQIWDTLVTTAGPGLVKFVGLPPVCSTNSWGIIRGCSDQMMHLIKVFGYPLTAPRVTPDKFTPEFFAGVPLPPTQRCCESAVEFQAAMCACNPETITAMRELGLFDPEMTVPFADWLYGDICGGITFLAEECPNGSPFDIVGGRRRRRSSMRRLAAAAGSN